MKAPIARTLLAGALAALALVGGATAARAEPANCTATPVTGGAQARCTAGSGLVRAGVDCIAKNEFETIQYGPWVGVGGVSTAMCFGGSRRVDWWYEVA